VSFTGRFVLRNRIMPDDAFSMLNPDEQRHSRGDLVFRVGRSGDYSYHPVRLDPYLDGSFVYTALVYTSSNRVEMCELGFIDGDLFTKAEISDLCDPQLTVSA
jgi:hypothetical protein